MKELLLKHSSRQDVSYAPLKRGNCRVVIYMGCNYG
jgi:hypothetical protein